MLYKRFNYNITKPQFSSPKGLLGAKIKVMKEFKNDNDLFDPLGDKMAAVLVILLTIMILFVAVITTKFVYEGGGIWPAVGWVIGWIACFILSHFAAKNL